MAASPSDSARRSHDPANFKLNFNDSESAGLGVTVRDRDGPTVTRTAGVTDRDAGRIIMTRMISAVIMPVGSSRDAGRIITMPVGSSRCRSDHHVTPVGSSES